MSCVDYHANYQYMQGQYVDYFDGFEHCTSYVNHHDFNWDNMYDYGWYDHYVSYIFLNFDDLQLQPVQYDSKPS